jgi:F0F1-type ATP synthase delta subunit
MQTTLLNKITSSQTYKRLQSSLDKRPTLYVDWISITNRSWCAEPINDLIHNPKLNQIIFRNQNKIDKLIFGLDSVVTEDHCDTVMNCMENISSNSSIYTIVDGIEEVLDGDRLVIFHDSLDSLITKSRIEDIVDAIEYGIENHRLEICINNLPKYFSGDKFDHFMQFCETHFDNDKEEMKNFLNSLSIFKVNLFIEACMRLHFLEKIVLFMSISPNISPINMKYVFVFILLMPIFVTEKLYKTN